MGALMGAGDWESKWGDWGLGAGGRIETGFHLLPSPYTLPYGQVSFHDLSIGFFPAKGETGISGLIA